ncbi:hypothetical protein D3C76_1655760 [compost metagenome]
MLHEGIQVVQEPGVGCGDFSAVGPFEVGLFCGCQLVLLVQGKGKTPSEQFRPGTCRAGGNVQVEADGVARYGGNRD